MADQMDLKAEIVSLIPRLRRFARGLCGNPIDADDLLQVALEKALSRLHQFEQGTRLDSWLFRIVQTSFLDERRKVQKREQNTDMTLLEQSPALQDYDRSAEQLALRDIDRAMATLPDDQRLLLVLVLVEGYSYQEAANLTGVPIGTVMSRLARGRKALAAQLEETVSVA